MSIYDQNMANIASAIDHAMKMGAVVLKPQSNPPVGFRPAAPSQPEEEPRG